MAQLMTMIGQNRLVIMIGILVLLILFSKIKSRSSKLLSVLIFVMCFSIIYEVITDEPVTNIPNRINRVLNPTGPKATKSTNPHYYEPPEKQYNLPAEN